MTSKTPLTIVGGFLGAGKTTLLNHVLHHADGRRLAVLVNDFGAVNIDAELIASQDCGVVRLSNGCLCCTIGDSFVDELVRVMRQPVPPDHVVIEASGVANPGRIAELAYLDPAFALHGVIVVADAEQVRSQAADKYVGDTVRDQIGSADLIILNKIDLIAESARRETESWLLQQAPHARIVRAVEAKLPVEVSLGFDEGYWGGFLRAEQQSRHDPAATFATVVFETDRRFSGKALRRFLDTLPSGVLRAKGFLMTDDVPIRPAILHVVGPRWDLRPTVLGPAGPRTRLVFIGPAASLDESHLQARLAAALD